MNVPFFLAYKCSSSVDHFPRTFLLLGLSCKNWTSPVSPLPHAHDHQLCCTQRLAGIPQCLPVLFLLWKWREKEICFLSGCINYDGNDGLSACHVVEFEHKGVSFHPANWRRSDELLGDAGLLGTPGACPAGCWAAPQLTRGARSLCQAARQKLRGGDGNMLIFKGV